MKSVWMWLAGCAFVVWIFGSHNESSQKASDSHSIAQMHIVPSAYLDFKGYRCTVDCSGHEAGYEWASSNDIDDIDDCVGKSNSFIEGCQSFVEENMPEIEDDADEER
jgi:hypothetical protein